MPRLARIQDSYITGLRALRINVVGISVARRNGIPAGRVGVLLMDGAAFRSLPPVWITGLQSLRKYATNADRSSGLGIRSKWMPSVDATGGATPGGAAACTALKNSM